MRVRFHSDPDLSARGAAMLAAIMAGASPAQASAVLGDATRSAAPSEAERARAGGCPPGTAAPATPRWPGCRPRAVTQMGKEPRPGQSRPARPGPGRPRPAVPAGVIAVVRAPTAGQARAIVRGLILAAVPAVELTMTVPGAVRIIAEFAASALSGGTALGAGTVLDPEACSACAAAGAAFIVSPVTDPAVLARAHDRGLPYVGGALTPTEVLASMRAGSDAVKLFPVGSVGGAGYLRALREPLPGLRAVVSGGIAAAEVPGYLAAGAHAVCLGGALIDRAAARRGDVDAVAAHTRRVLDEITEADGHADDH